MKSVDKINKIPGLKEILDDCKCRVEALTGEKVTIHYSLRFHLLTTPQLQSIICSVCEVDWQQIISESRKAPIIIARHLYCYYAFTMQRKTLWQIAMILQRTDHSTIIHARDKVIRMIETKDDLYGPIINEIEQKISEVII
jgi:chromosomal replication initiation ATPase DnaA